MTFAWAQPLGYVRTDQELLLPILDRAIDAVVRGADSEYRAVAAILSWLERGEQAGRIALDFPRFNDLAAAMCIETQKRYQRMNNSRVVNKAIEDGFMGVRFSHA